MNADMFANINEFDLSGISDLKLQNVNESTSNELLPSNLLVMNSNNQKLMNYQLYNTYQQLQQNQQNLTNYNVSTPISIPVTIAATTQQMLSTSSEIIDNKRFENLIQNDRSKLAVAATSEIKPEDSNINDSLYRNNNTLYPYYKNNNIPFVSSVDEINQPINYASNIDNLYLYNNITNIDELNNIPMGGITKPVTPPESMLAEKVQYNSSKYIPLNTSNYYSSIPPAAPIQTMNDQLSNPIYINNDPKNTLINPISHTNEVLSIPPSINTINKETKYIYKRRKRQTIDKTTGNIIQKKIKKKSKINQDLIHEKPGGLVSVNFKHNRSPCSLNEKNPYYTPGFHNRRIRGKYNKTYEKNEYIARKFNVIDYPNTNNVQHNYNEIDPSTITTTPINYTKVKKEIENLSPPYLQYHLNNQVQNSEIYSPFLSNGSNVINNYPSINTKLNINEINPYFLLNDPKTLPKQLVTPQYIVNENEIKKEKKMTNLNSINDNVLLDTLIPVTFDSSTSSMSSSPNDTSLTSSSISINNSLPLNNIIITTTANNTIPFISNKTDQIKLNNTYTLV
ncbi:hypothetical protein BCR36DRAFT_314930 [Piromyces finnis]|uniref:Uncharacterized protein n=1 Tax=Piromyces finnis TaxID=1754191 RepID=A0A1Y1VP42_9FUNG|nr:hypothetical protein BCR36DRAFT_314930 [Piromyces finnis]|eukprot:ORX60923.1 hypothetical protein BCR36DRAFT_314930 [Piromyces finnis]